MTAAERLRNWHRRVVWAHRIEAGIQRLADQAKAQGIPRPAESHGLRVGGRFFVPGTSDVAIVVNLIAASRRKTA